MPTTKTTTHYDYARQVWVADGRYVKCGHLAADVDELTQPGDAFTACQCYGRLHAGEDHECGEGCA